MSIIKSIKQVLGLGPAAENHFWDGSVPNQLSLKRGTPEAPGATVMQVVDGVARFSKGLRLGDNAASPAIKQVMFSGITATPHGVSEHSLNGITTPDKIIGISAILDNGTTWGTFGDWNAQMASFVDLARNVVAITTKASPLPTEGRPYKLIVSYID